MKQVAIWAVLLFLIPSQGGKSQQSAQDSRPLKGLQGVHIVVEDVGTAGRSIGLSELQLESQVLVGLKRDIPRLKIDDSSPPFIVVNVTTDQGQTVGGRVAGFHGCVAVEVYRRVIILSDDSRMDPRRGASFAIVWQKSMIFIGSTQSAASLVYQTINEMLTSFSADYYRQNP